MKAFVTGHALDRVANKSSNQLSKQMSESCSQAISGIFRAFSDIFRHLVKVLFFWEGCARYKYTSSWKPKVCLEAYGWNPALPSLVSSLGGAGLTVLWRNLVFVHPKRSIETGVFWGDLFPQCMVGCQDMLPAFSHSQLSMKVLCLLKATLGW